MHSVKEKTQDEVHVLNVFQFNIKLNKRANFVFFISLIFGFVSDFLFLEFANKFMLILVLEVLIQV